MTLDATKPTDQELVSLLPSYIRANRSEINTIESDAADVVFTELLVSGLLATLVVETDVSGSWIEVIKVNSVGAASIKKITGGTEGQIKLFLVQGDDLDFVDGSKMNGELYLNELPGSLTYEAAADDVIAFVNVDGDGVGTSGYWKELFRTISVK